MNNNGGYSPYMFGGSYGSGSGGNNGAPSNNYAGQSTRRDSFNVRDCMYWPESLGGGNQSQQSRGNYSQTSAFGGITTGVTPGDSYFPQAASMMGGFGSSEPYVFHAGFSGNDYNSNGTGEPMQQMPQQAPVKAYMSTPADGGSVGKPIQIPCHMGAGPGKLPQVPNQPAMGYKVTVPQIAPTAPVDFEIRQ